MPARSSEPGGTLVIDELADLNATAQKILLRCPRETAVLPGRQ